MNNNLLLKYVTGKCTPRQEEEVEHWLNASPKNRTTMEEFKHISKVPPSKRIEVDTHGAWDAFSRKYFLDEGSENQGKRNEPSPNKSTNFQQSTPRRLRRPTGVTYGIAAAAAVLLAVLFYYVAGFPTPDGGTPQVVSQKITTQKGQRTTVRLSDGTRIHLNAESRLSVAAGYNSDNRRVVYLEGEAFFEVASDRHRPFEVHTAGSVTRVMGTKFNVNAYPDQENVQVVVSEGKVALGSGRQSRSPEVQLSRYQKGTISPGGEVTASKVSDLGVYLDWSRGRLTFQDSPMQEIERRLERWFDIEVTMEKGITSQTRLLTGSFKDVPLSSVLHSIALSLDIKYQQKGRSVIFEDR